MATVTGLTADRMLQIEAESIVDGAVDVNGHLILTRHDGGTIDAGYIVDATNNVNRVGDQTVDGLKTFQKKVTVGVAGGSALRVGKSVAGQEDALNITPYGAAAAVLVSGAERDAAGNSVARAASATQIEMLNSGVNIYADTGLVVGNNYTRTKVLGVDQTGQVTITRPASGTSLYATKEAASMSGGSIVIGRSATNTPQSLVFSYGTAVNFVVGRSASTDNLEFGTDGGAGFTKKGHIDTAGTIRSIGPASYFGGGALDADMSFVAVGQYDPDYASISCGNAVRANTHLLIQGKGNGLVIIRNGANPGNSLQLDTNGKVTINSGGGAGVNSDGLEVYCSAMAAGSYVGVRIRSNWGSGAGGAPLHIQNAVGPMFFIDGNGQLNWGSGANIAGVFVGTATAGGGQATPATVVGFMSIIVNGTQRKIPYYAA